MLQLSATFTNKPIMSLRTGARVATVASPIINPNNLKIEGFYCQDIRTRQKLVLLTQDIRDIISQGLVVNDHDVLSEPEDLIRLRKIMEIDLQIMGMPVVTVDKHKIGKINDYATDTQTLYIQKLYVAQPLIKSLSGGQLSVDRSQIVEITNRKIVIQEPLQPTKAGIRVTAPVAS